MEEQIGGDEADTVALTVFEINDGLPEQSDVLRISALGCLGGQRGLHHKPHLGQLLEGRVVQQEEKFHRHGQYRGSVPIEVAAVSDLLRNDTHNLENLERGA